jgi:hypothetical protein
MLKPLLILLAVIIVAAGAGVGVYVLRQSTFSGVSADPATTLTMRPSDTNPDVGDTFTVAIDIDTAENSIVVAELRLNFDPSKLEATDIVPGNFITNPDTRGPEIDNSQGTVSFDIIALGGGSNTGVQGQGVLATLTLKAIGSGTATVGFSPNTLVAAIDEETNVLVSSQPTTVTISGTTGPSPTPTTPPGASPTPTIGTSELTITITNPVSGSTVATTTPIFTGTTAPNASINLNLSGPTPLTYSSTANSTGGWSWLPSTNLSGGSYTFTATATQAGKTATATTNFTVSVSTGGNSPTSTPVPTQSTTTTTTTTSSPSPTPVTSLPQAGTTAPTLLILVTGAGLLLLGFITLILI